MKALITGITGQDGSYLAELLLDKNYEVHGIMRRSSTFNTKRINHIFDYLTLFHGDMADGSMLTHVVANGQYDEIYNLAAQSHVKVSFDIPEYTGDVDGLGVTRLLEAVRMVSPKTKFYQASSSEMFGGVRDQFEPRSPYACAKVYSHYMVQNYRKAYGMFACNGILFNHESPRRGETFVTRKITRAIKKIKDGLQLGIRLGNVDARRDWGYAPDYVKAMWLMLQQDVPDDYVIATGESHSVQEFLTAACDYAGIDWWDYLVIDKQYLRPLEVHELIGDYSKAKKMLGWEPTVTFEELVRIMVDAEK